MLASTCFNSIDAELLLAESTEGDVLEEIGRAPNICCLELDGSTCAFLSGWISDLLLLLVVGPVSLNENGRGGISHGEIDSLVPFVARCSIFVPYMGRALSVNDGTGAAAINASKRFDSSPSAAAETCESSFDLNIDQLDGKNMGMGLLSLAL